MPYSRSPHLFFTTMVSLGSLALAGCGGKVCQNGLKFDQALTVTTPLPEESVLILAPHPDDEVLFGGGVLKAALDAGKRVYVAIATNGDVKGPASGLRRQHESVAALDIVGLPEDHIIFLGYGDQSLSKLWKNDSNSIYQAKSGATRTYAESGLGKVDFHTHNEGHPAEYTHRNVGDDLQNLIRLVHPDKIYVTSMNDRHPDHKYLNMFLLEALAKMSDDKAFGPKLPFPHVFEAVVHFNADGKNWGGEVYEPNGQWTIPNKLAELQTPRGSLVRIPVPDDMRLDSTSENTKVRMLRTYASQFGAKNFMLGFVKSEEIFWELDLEIPQYATAIENAVESTCH